MAGTKQADRHLDTDTLDSPRTASGVAVGPSDGPINPSLECRADVCGLGDHGSTWGGTKQFTCKREDGRSCAFDTLDEGVARARNPKAFAKK